MTAEETTVGRKGVRLSVDWWAVLVAAVLVAAVLTGVFPTVGW